MILVDPAVWPWRGRYWAHLASDDSADELHDFAARLGLRRLAFQGDHYDVDETGRGRALRAGARPVSARELVGRLRAAGLRRRGPRARLRWEVMGEWPLGELTGAAACPEGPLREPTVGAARPAGPLAEFLPTGPLAGLVLAGGAMDVADEVVLRVLVRQGEVAAVLARAGCDQPLVVPEVVKERVGRPRRSRPTGESR